MDSVSRKGYKNNSPYKNSPYLVINSPKGVITMDNVDKPLLGIDIKNNESKVMKPNSGEHYFRGDVILEVPLNSKNKNNMFGKPTDKALWQDAFNKAKLKMGGYAMPQEIQKAALDSYSRKKGGFILDYDTASKMQKGGKLPIMEDGGDNDDRKRRRQERQSRRWDKKTRHNTVGGEYDTNPFTEFNDPYRKREPIPYDSGKNSMIVPDRPVVPVTGSHFDPIDPNNTGNNTFRPRNSGQLEPHAIATQRVIDKSAFEMQRKHANELDMLDRLRKRKLKDYQFGTTPSFMDKPIIEPMGIPSGGFSDGFTDAPKQKGGELSSSSPEPIDKRKNLATFAEWADASFESPGMYNSYPPEIKEELDNFKDDAESRKTLTEEYAKRYMPSVYEYWKNSYSNRVPSQEGEGGSTEKSSSPYTQEDLNTPVMRKGGFPSLSSKYCRKEGGSVSSKYQQGMAIRYKSGGEIKEGVVKNYNSQTGEIELY